MRYYSEVLDKLFDTEKDLLSAEKAFQKRVEVEKALKAKEAEEAKKKADERAARAKEVEAAAKAVQDAQKAYREKLNAFTKDYGGFHMTIKSDSDSFFDNLINLFF